MVTQTLPIWWIKRKQKKQVASIIGEDYMILTIGVYEMVRKLLKGILHVRVDLDNVNDKYISVNGLSSVFGNGPFNPRKYDYVFGE